MENKNTFIIKLDNILLSKNVRKSFYEVYENDIIFKEQLDKLIPEISICRNQNQNTPWHIFNVLDHSLEAISYINGMTESYPVKDRRILSYVMFFHDTGKPAMRKIVVKNGKEFDSFRGHNIESCNIVMRVLPMLGFNKNEIMEILKLIENHDIFSTVSDKENILPYQTKLDKEFIINLKKDMSGSGDGEKLSEYLGLVAKADNLAQNPEMTVESLRIIDKFNEIINGQKESVNEKI